MPAVSVIMPAYNVAPYIGDAIESVLAQTFTDFELIVVNDGSTDATASIAGGYASDVRVRVVHQANGGISSARNHALRLARGDVFAILDSDDVWEPGYLAAQLRILAAPPEVDVVTGNAWFLGSSLHGQLVRPCSDPRPHLSLADILGDETAVFIMSVFRRRVFERIGPFDEDLRTNEDYDYWLRAAGAGFVFHRNDQPLGFYRRRDDSLSASELRMLPGILRVYRKLRPHLLDRPAELAILDRQVTRFETEQVAAEARAAIQTGDFAAASQLLAVLHARRGGAALRIVALMARWTPAVLSTLYSVHRARLATRAARARHRIA